MLDDDPDPGVRPGTLQDALAQTSFALMAALTEVAAAHDLSLTQLRVLGILRDRQPTMAELAAFTGLERSTVSGLIDRATQRGLIVKIPEPSDRRMVRVGLTPQSRQLARRMATDVEQRIGPLTDRLNPGEQKRLIALLTKLLGG